MRKPLFVVVAVLLSGSVTRADKADDDLAMALGCTALDPAAQPYARIAALEALAKFGSRAAPAVNHLVNLLNDGALSDSGRQDLFVFHAAQALGAIGFKARQAVDPLVRAQATVSDPAARRAIAAAVQTILQSSPPKAPAQRAADLLKDLANADGMKDPPTRLAAAKSLGTPLSGAKAADILKGLHQAVTKDDDPDVRQVAARSAKAVREANSKDPGYVQWTKDYVDALASMLRRPDSEGAKFVNDRLFAAKALGELGARAPYVPLELLQINQKQGEDEDVKGVAANAIKKLSQPPPLR